MTTDSIERLRRAVVAFKRGAMGGAPGDLVEMADALAAFAHEHLLPREAKPRLLTPGQRAAHEDRGRAVTRDEMVRTDRADILAKAKLRAVRMLVPAPALRPEHRPLRIGDHVILECEREVIPIEDLADLLEGKGSATVAETEGC